MLASGGNLAERAVRGKKVWLPMSLARRLLLGNFLVAATVIALAGLALYHGQRQHSQRAEAATRDSAWRLAQNIAAVIDKTDFSLGNIALELERQTARGGIDTDALNRFLAQQKSFLPEITNLRLADAQGTVRFGIGRELHGGLGMADRDYFIRARDNPEPELIISGPTLVRSTSNWGLLLARRLARPDGSFAGVVFASIGADYFQSLFASINLGAQGTISLHMSDLRLVASRPAVENIEAISSRDAMSAELRQAMKASPETGSYFARSPMEGRSSYSRVADHPLYVVAGFAAADYLGDFRSDAIKITMLAALVILAALGSSWLTYRRWMRERRGDGVPSEEDHRSAGAGQ